MNMTTTKTIDATPNGDLNVLIQNLSNRTLNYSVEQIMNELTIIAERLSFAKFDSAKSKTSSEVLELLEYLLARDISPSMMSYVKFLAETNQLDILRRDGGKAFIEACRNYFSTKKQIVLRSPVGLSALKQKQIAVSLFSLYPVSSRVIFETDPALIAGFVLFEDGTKITDQSLRSRAGTLIEAYIRKRIPTPWTQTAPQ